MVTAFFLRVGDFFSSLFTRRSLALMVLPKLIEVFLLAPRGRASDHMLIVIFVCILIPVQTHSVRGWLSPSPALVLCFARHLFGLKG